MAVSIDKASFGKSTKSVIVDESFEKYLKQIINECS